MYGESVLEFTYYNISKNYDVVISLQLLKITIVNPCEIPPT